MTILKFPDNALRINCDPVFEGQQGIDSTVRHLIASINASTGVGLAAPQLGFNHRIFVMNPEKNGNVVVIANPIVKQGFDLKDKMEGCLSFPGLFDRVPRFERVEVSWDAIDPNTMKFIHHEDVITGFNAQVFQHETEHLSGILMIDHLAPHIQKRVQLKMEKRKARGW